MTRINKSNVIVILLNLLGLAAVAFLGQRLYRDVDQVISTYQELYTVTRGKENLAVAEKIITETATSQATINEAFLRGGDLILFIKKLESLAQTASVELDLDEPESFVDKVPGLNLTFRATGPFVGLYHFLALLENLPYRIAWQSIDWSFSSGTTWSGDFNLTIVSYTR
ncbi:MAG TPA: hypothetical protein VJB69_01140 [Candidatus Paceibacterota bacterium]